MRVPLRDPADEARHVPGADLAWEERWKLDYRSADRSVLGEVMMTLTPHVGRCAFASSLRVGERRLIVVDERDAPLPKWPHLEVRASGLWVELACLEPFAHFTVQLEAFGLELDDPGDLMGTRVPVALDLEWESEPAGSLVECLVHGEIRVGDDRIVLWGAGGRSHEWGAPC